MRDFDIIELQTNNFKDKRRTMFKAIFQIGYDYNAHTEEFDKINNEYKFCNDFVMYGDFSKINVFIGENNSGKSRFLRSLFSSNYDEISHKCFDDIYAAMADAISQKGLDSLPPLQAVNDICKSLNDGKCNFFDEENFLEIIKEKSTYSNVAKRFYFPVLRGVKDYKSTIVKQLNNFLSSVSNSIQTQDSVKHFISLLELAPSGLSSFDIYRKIIEREYFDSKTDKLVLTGGMLYQEIKSYLLGDKQERDTITEFQDFLYEHFFLEYGKVQLIPKEKDGVLSVKIGDDEREIYNWGDGTQQLITMLFSIFKHKDEDAVFFIEEPELYLHPGLLRKFIEVINLDMFNKTQYFITTHSNIVLDASADTNINMSIFKFKKLKDQPKGGQEKFTVEQCNNGDVSLLNELGVRNSSVFLSNCSIWVEGITDRLYLKHYLKLYTDKYPEKKQFRENLDYTFIEYGGGNLVHLNFDPKDSSNTINAKYINNKIFLIADNDNSQPGSKKGQRKVHLKKVLNDNFYELPVVEVENLITQEILKEVLIIQNKGKEDVIRQKLNKERKFQNKKLGRFIDECFGDELRKYSADSGTISNKLEFCKKVIEKTTEYEQLSPEAKELTEKVYDFIKKNN